MIPVRVENACPGQEPRRHARHERRIPRAPRVPAGGDARAGDGNPGPPLRDECRAAHDVRVEAGRPRRAQRVATPRGHGSRAAGLSPARGRRGDA
jgi:hypothetical protein